MKAVFLEVIFVLSWSVARSSVRTDGLVLLKEKKQEGERYFFFL